MSVQPFRATVAEIGGRFALISLSGELDLYVERELRDTLEAAPSRRARVSSTPGGKTISHGT